MEKITINARAKVNLSLDVTGRRDDGYHLVEMVMQTVDLKDVIEIEKKEGNGIEIGCDFKGMPNQEDNLIYKAAKLLKDTYDIHSKIVIKLKKGIPVAAGMAGGSADAAGTLVGINELFSLGLKSDELKKLGLKLGADVPFCIEGGTYLASGIGEKLQKIKTPNLDILIVKPDGEVSTKVVYDAYDKISPSKRPDNMNLIKGIKEGNIPLIVDSMYNVLWEVTRETITDVDNIIAKMESLGATKAMMTGSGPTVFGIFEDLNKLKNAKEFFETRYKETYQTKTCAGGIEIE